MNLSRVPQKSEIDVIRGSVYRTFPGAAKAKPQVDLPMSKSFLKAYDVPLYCDFFAKEKEQTSGEDVEKALRANPTFASKASLAGPVRLVKHSDASAFKIAYFEVHDFQSGAIAKSLIGALIMVFGKLCRIGPAALSTGTPLCQRCWRWGHVSHSCRAPGVRCVICGEPHGEEHHRIMSSCCKAHPKANPPRPGTASNLPCPHNACCINCKGKHRSDSRDCPFWAKRFKEDWITARYQQVRAQQAASKLLSNPPVVG